MRLLDQIQDYESPKNLVLNQGETEIQQRSVTELVKGNGYTYNETFSLTKATHAASLSALNPGYLRIN